MEIARVDEATRGDAAAIITEYLHTIRDGVAAVEIDDEIARHLADDRAALFLARVDGAIAGCVEVHPLSDDTFEIKRLYVRSSARRLGLAAQLMDAAEAYAAARGARSICLDTKPSMEAAQALYRARGYHSIEPYHANAECHICLGKQLRGAGA